MEKKQYIAPQVEAEKVYSNHMQMNAFSADEYPDDPFNSAPERRKWWLF